MDHPLTNVTWWSLSVVLVCAVGSGVLVWFATSSASYTTAPTSLVTATSTLSSTTPPLPVRGLWITGDVMLSRQVGTYMGREGDDYPWRRLPDQDFPGTDYLLINFESCLSKVAAFSPAASMRFPVPAHATTALNHVGITHASLANNHALDCGPKDLEVTRIAMEQAEIVPVGHPTQLGTSTSVTIIELGKHRIAVIALHTLFVSPTESVLRSVIEYASGQSDYQLLYVHWGDEYLLSAGRAQQNLAKTVADLGVDLVIGHHPHVVQDIGLVGSTTVVYSLGNFIFDQYFSGPVQEGLVVRLDGGATKPMLTLHPVTSRDSRTQPRFMTEAEAAEWLANLAARSDERLQSDIAAGRLSINQVLATSTKPAIITP
jgi:poly-gamma-glutamate capsule biosynthesis protein CapA/YwtB (metallophosphatase superfamily)